MRHLNLKKIKQRTDRRSREQYAKRQVQAYNTNELNRRIDRLLELVTDHEIAIQELRQVIGDTSDKREEVK